MMDIQNQSNEPNEQPALSDVASTAAQQIINGDCLAVLQSMPEASIDCVVTSPPLMSAFKGELTVFRSRGLRERPSSGCSCARQETGPLDVG